MAATLLKDVRIRQEYYFHHFGAGHTPVHPGVQDAGTSYQLAAPEVVGRLWPKTLPIGAPGKTET